MERLKKEDKTKLSKILNDNWDLVFKLLTGSPNDEDGVPYREVYKWELQDRENDFTEIIDVYLENNAFYDRNAFRSWIVEGIVGGLLRDVDCRTIQFYQCINQLYNALFSVIKPYYIGLYPTHEKKDYCKIIETNLSMKDGQVYDHQSRLLEADNWNDYVDMFKEYDGYSVDRFRAITEMVGCSIPKNVEIMNLTYDDKHLSCDLKHKDGWIEKKLAYKCWIRY